MAIQRIEFDPTSQRLLFKEASLIAMNLGIGLTNLRKHDFTRLGYFYQASFSLSIGLERLMKLILIYEYYIEHLAFPPDNRYLKRKGHNLIELFNSVKELFTKYQVEHKLQEIEDEPICLSILKNLSDFAVQNRYFHLDKLSNTANSSNDPLFQWNEEVNKPILQKHYKPNLEHERSMNEMAEIISHSSSVMHFNEEDNLITDYRDFVKEGFGIETKQRFSTFYTYCLLRALCTLQEEQNRTHYSNACLYEFLTAFRIYDDSTAKKKKTWDPFKL